ncbi:NAD(P)/FAD-dependent oxidoreductase [Streptomyces mayonensis]|uniref:NAD(P)/FAD-dependent oxidoreductase n=1 Tax=Streptomyces mayonensis TaxID=2750816 RepID=UPI001C1E3F21|nr:FAD-dependent oxidoreductase [Streptomyces sp. A108]MBU6529594.1 FAD-dependent oxidoreductase [Streptomyces sp. A108]
MSSDNDGIVIVGASAAGLSAADGLREGGYTGPLTVLDEEADPGYDRPMLSKSLLAAKEHVAPAALRTRDQLAAKQIELIAGHGAKGLDIDRRLVVTNCGEAIGWQHLVIATGVTARPVVTTGGTPLPTLRTRGDLAAVRLLATSGEPVTLVGGGFVGLEAAAALRSRGVDVTLLCANHLPLAGALGDAIAIWLHGLHLANGVRFRLGSATHRVAETPQGYDIHLADGRAEQATNVLAGIGTEPATDWLVGSGVQLDHGVVTDAAGRTNVDGVWAAGDIACRWDQSRRRHRRFEHWTHAIEQGRRVGLNIARGEATAHDAVPYVWTEQYGLTLHMLGERRPGDTDIVVEGSITAGDFVVVHGTDDELHGATICGRVRALRTLKKLLRARASLNDALGSAASA